MPTQQSHLDHRRIVPSSRASASNSSTGTYHRNSLVRDGTHTAIDATTTISSSEHVCIAQLQVQMNRGYVVHLVWFGSAEES
jgi:hypothetical protein